MLKQTSKNFRKDFILEFTKELIRATKTYREVKIKKEVKIVLAEQKSPKMVIPQKKNVQKVIKEKMKRDSKTISEMKVNDPFGSFFSGAQKPIMRRIPSVLRIPDSPLPPTVQYIRPSPTANEINLGKLNPLLRDPMVKVIECNGPEDRIFVGGRMGRKPTSIQLNKEEIDDVINGFSQATKIPIQEGVFKVVFGRLILLAIVSEVVGNKFIIKKISGPPRF